MKKMQATRANLSQIKATYKYEMSLELEGGYVPRGGCMKALGCGHVPKLPVYT